MGAACDFENRCPYRSRCDGVCVATVGHGEGCVDDVDCDAGACEEGVCVALLAGGVACARDAQCARGSCDGVCADFVATCTGP